jgi:hypothetical protein
MIVAPRAPRQSRRKAPLMHRLTVALFATSDANHATHLADYVAGANTMLATHSMALEIFSTNPAGGARILPYTGAVFDSAGDPGTVRGQCHAAVPVGRGIPVIFCKRNTDTATSAQIELGSTIQTANTEANNGIQWLPYILINTQGKSTANEVLLHEMIHAAYGANQPNKPRDPHDPDPGSCFYQFGTVANAPNQSGKPTRTLPSKHADVLRKAYFSVFVP